MQKLAIHGGKKIRTKLFPPYKVIGKSEIKLAKRVLKSNILSRYLGAWHEDFYGGPEVKSFEKEWARFFKVKHAIAVNSATSGLYCAVGALGIGPGDEVIVPPYTMSASVMAPLIYNAIPVFADIEEDYFCIDKKSVEKLITPRTKAIVAVDFFGQAYDADGINKLAKKYGIKVIEDCAQAPMALYKGKFAGTLGDIGIYSLNYHKHIHTGEGGVIVTDNDVLAEKLRLIRNHAEAVVGPKGETDLVNMIGFNFRMTEIQAAIGRGLLKKLPGLIKKRQKNVRYFSKKISEIPGIYPAKTRPGATHVYYMHALKYDKEQIGVHRDIFVDAVKAELMPIKLRETEGVKINAGSVRPLYLLPIFQKKVGYGKKGCPWKCGFYKGKVSYEKGICPVCERMYENEVIVHEYMRPGMSKKDMDDVIKAFWKVWEEKESLKEGI